MEVTKVLVRVWFPTFDDSDCARKVNGETYNVHYIRLQATTPLIHAYTFSGICAHICPVATMVISSSCHDQSSSATKP